MNGGRTKEGQGLLLAFASAAAFGTNIVSAQIAGAAGLGGPLLVFYRVLIMLVLVGAVALLEHFQAKRIPVRVKKTRQTRR